MQDQLFDVPGSVGDTIATLWTHADAAHPDEPNIMVVLSRTDRSEWVFVGTLADLDSWDPFAADDGWPGPAVGGYSAMVSPMLPLAWVWDMTFLDTRRDEGWLNR